MFEYVSSSLKKISYSYHYQDAKNKIVFRYDNESHYPQIPSYHHHKHTQDRELPEASSEPDLKVILKEVTVKLIEKFS
ncbi:MAG: toxin-antitoxin system TumE family protein [Nitrososphaerales archaeon]